MLRLTILHHNVSLLRCLELSYEQMNAEILFLSFLQNFHASKIATYVYGKQEVTVNKAFKLDNEYIIYLTL